MDEKALLAELPPMGPFPPVRIGNALVVAFDEETANAAEDQQARRPRS